MAVQFVNHTFNDIPAKSCQNSGHQTEEEHVRYIWQTPEEIGLAIAQRLRLIRKKQKLTQKQLSLRSNVNYSSIKRFESSGKISLINLTMLCVALGCVEELRKMFINIEYLSIDEVNKQLLLLEQTNKPPTF